MRDGCVGRINKQNTIIKNFHSAEKQDSLPSFCFRGPGTIQTIQLRTVGRCCDTVVRGRSYDSTDISVLLHDRVVLCFLKRPERVLGGCIPQRIFWPSYGIGGIHQVIFAVVFERTRPLGPASIDCVGQCRPVLPTGMPIGKTHRWTQQQDRFADDTAEVRFQFDAIDPAFLNLRITPSLRVQTARSLSTGCL